MSATAIFSADIVFRQFCNIEQNGQMPGYDKIAAGYIAAGFTRKR